MRRLWYRCRRVLAAALAIVAASVVVGCMPQPEWLEFRGRLGQGRASAAISPPLGIRWKLRLQVGGERLEAFNPPVVRDDTIYFGSADGNFYALDIESGYMRWVFPTGAPINSVPYVDEDRVYFGSTDGYAYALARDNGSLHWSYATGREVNSTFTRYRDQIVFASDGGSTHFLSLDGVPLLELPNPVWYYITFQMYDDQIYFAPGPPGNAYSLGVYDIVENAYRWILETSTLNATWFSFPAIDDDRLFMATSDYRGDYWLFTYRAYERLTGRRLWEVVDYSRFGIVEGGIGNNWQRFRADLKKLDYQAPAVHGNTVIFTSGDAVVRAFDSRSGELRWQTQFDYPTTSAPTVAGDRVYFGVEGSAGLPSAGGGTTTAGTRPADAAALDAAAAPPYRPSRLVALSVHNGREVWSLDIDGSLLSAPVIAGKWLMFGTDASFFYILEELF